MFIREAKIVIPLPSFRRELKSLSYAFMRDNVKDADNQQGSPLSFKSS